MHRFRVGSLHMHYEQVNSILISSSKTHGTSLHMVWAVIVNVAIRMMKILFTITSIVYYIVVIDPKVERKKKPNPSDWIIKDRMVYRKLQVLLQSNISICNNHGIEQQPQRWKCCYLNVFLSSNLKIVCRKPIVKTCQYPCLSHPINWQRVLGWKVPRHVHE